jgi:hypothetical protein
MYYLDIERLTHDSFSLWVYQIKKLWFIKYRSSKEAFDISATTKDYVKEEAEKLIQHYKINSNNIKWIENV